MSEVQSGTEKNGGGYLVRLIDRKNAVQARIENPRDFEEQMGYIIRAEGNLGLKTDRETLKKLPSDIRIFCHKLDDPSHLPPEMVFSKFATVSGQTSIFYALPDIGAVRARTTTPEGLEEATSWLEQQAGNLDGRPHFVIPDNDEKKNRLAALRFIQKEYVQIAIDDERQKIAA